MFKIDELFPGMQQEDPELVDGEPESYTAYDLDGNILEQVINVKDEEGNVIDKIYLVKDGEPV